MLLCEADRSSIEVAETLLLMDLHSSFQSERHIAPYVMLYIISFCHADESSGRTVQACLAGVKPLLSPNFDSGRRDTVIDRKDSGSVMRNVSKAKFDGNLLGSYRLEEQSQ